ncbi:MAG: hypothetical protein GYA45_10005 [Pelolinea sp.]|jgi:hypothetical protein|nr:hypothetical protein [Pelolinea sp.]
MSHLFGLSELYELIVSEKVFLFRKVIGPKPKKQLRQSTQSLTYNTITPKRATLCPFSGKIPICHFHPHSCFPSDWARISLARTPVSMVEFNAVWVKKAIIH